MITAATLIVLAVPLIWLSVTDLEGEVIPDPASVMVAMIGLASLFYRNDPFSLETIGAAVAVTLFLSVAGGLYWRHYGREAFGLGDAKLVGAGTLVVGLPNLWLMLFLAAAGGIIGAFALGRRHQNGIPFGPFLAYAIFLVGAVSDRGVT